MKTVHPGVLTKPDTLTSGATKSKQIWLDVIGGHQAPLKHGYYVTRQPDDDALSTGITTEQARAAEHDFFSHTSPWSTSPLQQRFGTNNLVQSLATLLSKLIDDGLVSRL